MITAADKSRISAAIRAVEAHTAGEIFCVVARRSGDDRHVPLVWAASLALLVPLPAIYLAGWSAPTVYLAQLATFLAGAAALSLPALRHRLLPRRVRSARAHAEAMRQFFAQGLDRTEHRTGVLIFASTAERHAEIVADAGINAKVDGAVWDQAVATLVASIKAGQPADGFIAAIEQCGAVLAEHFPPGALPRDELPDRLVEI
jgi:putative membrane protein